MGEVVQTSTNEVNFLVANLPHEFQRTFDHQPQLAFDVNLTRQRYEELRKTVDDQAARQLMTQYLIDELVTHFGELGGEDGRVGGFSYRYMIDETGILVEDSVLRRSIREMFKNQDGVVADLWKNHLITELESMPVGATAFTLSARQDNVYEGQYDYAYAFMKMAPDEIHAYGLELVLSKSDQAAVLNHIYQMNDHFLLMLTDEPSADEVRSRAFVFPPNQYASINELFSHVIGEVVQNNRSPEELEHYLEEQKRILAKKRLWAADLAEEMIETIDTGEGLAAAKELLRQHHIREIQLYNPHLIEEAWLNGGTLLLPCGYVSLFNSSNILHTAGQGLVMVHEHGTCPEIQCRRCKNKDISESDTECRKCGWKPGDPIEVPKKTEQDKKMTHYQEQIKAEKLKKIEVKKKGKKEKKELGFWEVLFGLSR